MFTIRMGRGMTTVQKTLNFGLSLNRPVRGSKIKSHGAKNSFGNMDYFTKGLCSILIQ